MAWTLVQSKSADVAASTSIPVTLDSNVTVGNLLIAYCRPVTVATATSITDSRGNSYTTAETILNLDRTTIGTYSVVTSGGADTVTGHLDVSGDATIYVEEWSQSGTITLDQHTSQHQASPGVGTDAVTSGAVTTTADGELISGFCAMRGSGDIMTTGTGYTQDFGAGGAQCEYRTQTSAGSIAATATTNNGGGDAASIIMTFKASVAASALMGAILL